MEKMKITYTIGTHNEGEVIASLLNLLIPIAYNENDEVLIIDDYSTDEKTKEIINGYAQSNKTVSLMHHELNKDFATHKNFMTDKASGDFIFNIDADEFPSDYLLNNVKQIISTNSEVDLFIVPRINIVEDITEEDIKRYSWQINDKSWINWPDFQSRIYKRCSNIRWKNCVHETITGYKQFAYLPQEEQFALYHLKTIKNQRQQNEFYLTIKN
jgi:glycosyltransferase involved in cell wall biosynthesis